MTERTIHVASGKHLMSPLIEVGDGKETEGDHFPLAWNGKPVAVSPVKARLLAAKA